MSSVGGPDLDRELVQTFQRGDESAYDAIYARYRGRVYSVCHRMLGRAPEAEEATQETFLRAYQALGRFNGSYYLGAWLSRIAANVCVDSLRSRGRTTLVALPDDLEDLKIEPGPEEVVVGDHPRLDAAIEAIQPLHASALHLRAVQGLSHQEMAHHLAMTPSQVKALLHRARASLRRAWDRVEGMALVPLFYVRRFLDERTGPDAGGGIAGVAPAVGPALAEKVAASAVVVVAALSGISGTVVTPAPVPSELSPATPLEAGRVIDELPARGAAATAGPADNVAPPEVAPPALLAVVGSDLALPFPEKEEPSRRKQEQGSDGGGSTPPAQGAGNEALREVRQVARDVKDSLTEH